MAQPKGCIPWNKGIKTGIVPTNAFPKGHVPWCTGKSLPKGENSFSWKGGRRVRKDGYIEIRVYDSPSVHKDGYILEHRYLMEKHLGRTLGKKEIIHHINRNRTDNRIENLFIINGHSDHARLHAREKTWVWAKSGIKECINCGKNKYKHYAKGLCQKCYSKRQRAKCEVD